MTGTAGLLTRLVDRGIVAQTTDPAALGDLLDRPPVSFYTGFDPTAPSLHVGNLVQILLGIRLQRAGHRPVILIGGATGLIGDPKAAGERALNSPDVVAQWSSALTAQLSRLYDQSGSSGVIMVNNIEWTAPLTAISLLRDIGKHISINRMLDREAIAVRLAGPGISYTEFSYAILQAYDYVELHRRYGVNLQTGGSDQWGNITAGVDLVRRMSQSAVHALTTPLLTKADGTKFGKTESGTIWLDPALTSSWDFYQFWRNADDRDLPGLLATFSLSDAAEVEQILADSRARPSQRIGQQHLADSLTDLVHGESTTRQVTAAAAALFGRGSLAGVDPRVLLSALQQAGLTDWVEPVLPTPAQALHLTGLSASLGAARRTIAEGGASVNNERITNADEPIPADRVLPGGLLVIRRGRRAIAGIAIAQPPRRGQGTAAGSSGQQDQ